MVQNVAITGVLLYLCELDPFVSLFHLVWKRQEGSKRVENLKENQLLICGSDEPYSALCDQLCLEFYLNRIDTAL